MNIKQWMKSRRLSLEDVADIINRDVNRVWRITQGSIPMPDEFLKIKFASKGKVKADDVILSQRNRADYKRSK